jgi:hypothetical protein
MDLLTVTDASFYEIDQSKRFDQSSLTKRGLHMAVTRQHSDLPANQGVFNWFCLRVRLASAPQIEIGIAALGRDRSCSPRSSYSLQSPRLTNGSKIAACLAQSLRVPRMH